MLGLRSSPSWGSVPRPLGPVRHGVLNRQRVVRNLPQKPKGVGTDPQGAHQPQGVCQQNQYIVRRWPGNQSVGE